MTSKSKDTPEQGWVPSAEGREPRPITPLEIQQKEFAVARFGGYKMRDVDEFLDELTESVAAVIAENERLRRQAGAEPVVGAPDLDDVARQADEIIQRARDEAGRITAAANEQAASIVGTAAAGGIAASDAAGAEAVQAFLAKEREFLQSLAGLVQGHVESVKGMARRAPKVGDAAAVEAVDTDVGADARSEATAEQVSDAGSPEPEASAEPIASPEVDVTQVMSEPDEPIRVEEPQRAGATSGKRDEGDDSLRELFWGEEG